ncbi:2-hydroxyacid dehydrogenase [Oricola cellulosilytica]|uniref:2-hydroxyacid dehydrogenase n=1 Tax=Oricola cellulosilytica TaxID=1429082 RepID=A0A4R0P3B9_9HYPH|nr:2-hydroxyacid dehydrogenase [Oricola cellulosilytica]TCD11350.1 2-hydroxyacid dehydrogenase [Oricola cellulosilytica]
MSNATKPISIVLPEGFNQRATDRICKEFDPVILKRPDPELVPAEKREEIRGMAAWLDPAWIPLIDALPNLEIVSNFGVGYDPESSLHAIGKGIPVTHTPSVLDEEVADTALALLLNTVRELYFAEEWLRGGKWKNEGNYRLTPLTLRERTVGIYGLGRIGKAIARRIEAFGLMVHYHNRNPDPEAGYKYHDSLASLAAAVDTLIVVAPGTPSTRHTVNADILKALGPEGVLVNIGRGTVVDEAALIRALADKTIAAAGLDVFEDEPHVPADLIAMRNVCLLPHVGSASVHTRGKMGDLVADNLVSWFTQGKAITPVPEARDIARRREN